MNEKQWPCDDNGQNGGYEQKAGADAARGAQAPVRRRNTALLSALCGLAVVLVILAVVLIFRLRSGGEKEARRRVLLAQPAGGTAEEIGSTSAAAETAPTEAAQASAAVSAVTSTSAASVTAETAAAAVGGVSAPGLYRVSYATPSHAGVVVRGAASSTSEKRGVLPEGTQVEYLGSVSNGYAKIRWQNGGGMAEGWVMAVYLVDFTPGALAAENTGAAGSARISAATPSHAGVVLRGGPSSQAEYLGVLPEGTPVRVIGGVENEYIQISSDYGTGWVMAVYVVD